MIKRRQNVIVVHNAKDEEEMRELTRFEQEANDECKSGETAVVVINFDYAPIVPVVILVFPSVMSTAEALKAAKEELDSPDMPFKGARRIRAKTDRNPSDILRDVLDENS